MAIMQYIGARYVPLLYGEWIPNKQNGWEPLTIVTYLGDSYTSKKIVPPSVGNPAENPNYWVLTGAFNAQVEALRQQVLHLSDDVGEMQEDVTNLNKSELQFNVSNTYNSLDIICTALENVCNIKQRNNTLVINNNSDVEIYVQENTLYINTEV